MSGYFLEPIKREVKMKKYLFVFVYVFLFGSESAFAATAASADESSLITGEAKKNVWAEFNGPFITDAAKALGWLTPKQNISCLLNAFRAPDLFRDCSSYAYGLALFKALEEGDVKSADDYIEKGAYIYLQDQNGDTALHTAVRRGYIKTADLLLEKGADPDVPNKAGLTVCNLLHTQEHPESDNNPF